MDRRLLVLAALIALPACNEASQPAAAEPPPVAQPGPSVPNLAPMPVHSVESITFQIRESNPVQLVITARGMVRTGGWSNGVLRPLQTGGGPGTLSFTFTGTPPAPDMMVTQAFAPIEATYVVSALGSDVKAIRVVGETNELTQPLP
jgi:hypothetical protein